MMHETDTFFELRFSGGGKLAANPPPAASANPALLSFPVRLGSDSGDSTDSSSECDAAVTLRNTASADVDVAAAAVAAEEDTTEEAALSTLATSAGQTSEANTHEAHASEPRPVSNAWRRSWLQLPPLPWQLSPQPKQQTAEQQQGLLLQQAADNAQRDMELQYSGRHPSSKGGCISRTSSQHSHVSASAGGGQGEAAAPSPLLSLSQEPAESAHRVDESDRGYKGPVLDSKPAVNKAAGSQPAAQSSSSAGTTPSQPVSRSSSTVQHLVDLINQQQQDTTQHVQGVHFSRPKRNSSAASSSSGSMKSTHSSGGGREPHSRPVAVSPQGSNSTGFYSAHNSVFGSSIAHSNSGDGSESCYHSAGGASSSSSCAGTPISMQSSSSHMFTLSPLSRPLNTKPQTPGSADATSDAGAVALPRVSNASSTGKVSRMIMSWPLACSPPGSPKGNSHASGNAELAVLSPILSPEPTPRGPAAATDTAKTKTTDTTDTTATPGKASQEGATNTSGASEAAGLQGATSAAGAAAAAVAASSSKGGRVKGGVRSSTPSLAGSNDKAPAATAAGASTTEAAAVPEDITAKAAAAVEPAAEPVAAGPTAADLERCKRLMPASPFVAAYLRMRDRSSGGRSTATPPDGNTCAGASGSVCSDQQGLASSSSGSKAAAAAVAAGLALRPVSSAGGQNRKSSSSASKYTGPLPPSRGSSSLGGAGGSSALRHLPMSPTKAAVRHSGSSSGSSSGGDSIIGGSSSGGVKADMPGIHSTSLRSARSNKSDSINASPAEVQSCTAEKDLVTVPSKTPAAAVSTSVATMAAAAASAAAAAVMSVAAADPVPSHPLTSPVLLEEQGSWKVFAASPSIAIAIRCGRRTTNESNSGRAARSPRGRVTLSPRTQLQNVRHTLLDSVTDSRAILLRQHKQGQSASHRLHRLQQSRTQHSSAGGHSTSSNAGRAIDARLQMPGCLPLLHMAKAQTLQHVAKPAASAVAAAATATAVAAAAAKASVTAGVKGCAGCISAADSTGGAAEQQLQLRKISSSGSRPLLKKRAQLSRLLKQQLQGMHTMLGASQRQEAADKLMARLRSAQVGSRRLLVKMEKQLLVCGRLPAGSDTGMDPEIHTEQQQQTPPEIDSHSSAAAAATTTTTSSSSSSRCVSKSKAGSSIAESPGCLPPVQRQLQQLQPHAVAVAGSVKQGCVSLVGWGEAHMNRGVSGCLSLPCTKTAADTFGAQSSTGSSRDRHRDSGNCSAESGAFAGCLQPLAAAGTSAQSQAVRLAAATTESYSRVAGATKETCTRVADATKDGCGRIAAATRDACARAACAAQDGCQRVVDWGQEHAMVGCTGLLSAAGAAGAAGAAASASKQKEKGVATGQPGSPAGSSSSDVSKESADINITCFNIRPKKGDTPSAASSSNSHSSIAALAAAAGCTPAFLARLPFPRSTTDKLRAGSGAKQSSKPLAVQQSQQSQQPLRFSSLKHKAASSKESITGNSDTERQQSGVLPRSASSRSRTSRKDAAPATADAAAKMAGSSRSRSEAGGERATACAPGQQADGSSIKRSSSRRRSSNKDSQGSSHAAGQEGTAAADACTSADSTDARSAGSGGQGSDDVPSLTIQPLQLPTAADARASPKGARAAGETTSTAAAEANSARTVSSRSTAGGSTSRSSASASSSAERYSSSITGISSRPIQAFESSRRRASPDRAAGRRSSNNEVANRRNSNTEIAASAPRRRTPEQGRSRTPRRSSQTPAAALAASSSNGSRGESSSGSSGNRSSVVLKVNVNGRLRNVLFDHEGFWVLPDDVAAPQRSPRRAGAGPRSPQAPRPSVRVRQLSPTRRSQNQSPRRRDRRQ